MHKLFVSRFVPGLLLSFLMGSAALAMDTNLYEKEAPKVESFSAKVRTIRQLSDEVEVFFDSSKAHGAYTLPHSMKDYATALETLQDSEGKGGAAVTVSVDQDSQTIQSVQKNQSAKGPIDPVKDFDKIIGH